jgi:hypothetical protein
MAERRVVLVHYHIFKNAGTSLDRILQRNFGERWGTLEAAQGEGAVTPEELRAHLVAQPQLCALSSHTALLPAPESPDFRIVPLLLLRNPIDRIRSAYTFERKQNADTLGSRRAREGSFGDYVEHFLAQPNDRRFRNFQSWRLSRAVPAADAETFEFDRSLAALGQLPWVGIVEDFEFSLTRLLDLVKPLFPEFALHSVRANASSDERSTMEQRFEEIRSELGPEVYRKLCGANMIDWALWERAWRQMRDKQ